LSIIIITPINFGNKKLKITPSRELDGSSALTSKMNNLNRSGLLIWDRQKENFLPVDQASDSVLDDGFWSHFS